MNISVERAFLFVLFACVILQDADAQARGRIVPVDEMTQKSDVIGVATLRSSVCRVEERSGAICTDLTVSFSEVWKGEATPNFILVKPGGRIGDRGSTIPGQEYLLKVGEELVVFASPNKFGNHSPIGIRQGLYRVGPGPDHPLFRVSEYPESAGTSSPLTLQALKDEVRRALGRPVDSPATPTPPRPSSTPPSKETGPGSGSSEAASAPSHPAGSTNVPVTPSPFGLRMWAGLTVLFLLIIVATGVIISRRKSGLKS